jgi:predicted nucleic acid-binding protein
MVAWNLERNAYATAYLRLAQRLGEKLLTAGERLYTAIHADLE